jgi:hypothetical protein
LSATIHCIGSDIFTRIHEAREPMVQNLHMIHGAGTFMKRLIIAAAIADRGARRSGYEADSAG